MDINAGIIKILFLEDVTTDMELAEIELRRQGLRFESRRVENEIQFREALEKYDPALIISDYSLPGYDGMRAVQLVRDELRLATPFIILTGALNEVTAVECMKAGASDYVIKEHIKRLPFAAQEALRKAETLRARLEAETALQENEKRLRLALRGARMGLFDLDLRTGEAYTTDEYASILGYDPADFHENFTRWLDRLHPEEQGPLKHIFEEYIGGTQKEYRLEYRQRKQTGEWVWILSQGEILEWDESGHPVRLLGVTTDITESKIHEQDLKKSLDEKSILLRELYHRTKNNMQVMAGLLSLQASYTEDAKVLDFIKRTEHRILVMARVHQHLYESGDLSSIDLGNYIFDVKEIANSCFPESGINVTWVVTIDPVSVSLDTAVPLGLVLFELFANCLQHAFPEKNEGVITVRGTRKKADSLEIIVSDNGVGLPQGFDLMQSKSLGGQLVVGIVEHQLRGAFSYVNTRGLTCTLTLPGLPEAARI